MVSSIDQAKCSGCLLCTKICPFKAIDTKVLRDGRTVAVVNESLCKGCGLCVAGCRFGAANLRGFTQQQLLAGARRRVDLIAEAGSAGVRSASPLRYDGVYRKLEMRLEEES